MQDSRGQAGQSYGSMLFGKNSPLKTLNSSSAEVWVIHENYLGWPRTRKSLSCNSMETVELMSPDFTEIFLFVALGRRTYMCIYMLVTWALAR